MKSCKIALSNLIKVFNYIFFVVPDENLSWQTIFYRDDLYLVELPMIIFFLNLNKNFLYKCIASLVEFVEF